MLLDLSCNPVLVLPNECPNHVVVRTLGTRTVTGHVTWQEPATKANGKALTRTLKAGVSLPRGGSVCMETRLQPLLPLPQTGFSRLVRQSEPDALVVLPSPYEAATGYRDTLTRQYGEWRLVIQMQRRPTGTWVVTVGRYGEAPFVAVAVKDLIVDRGPLGRTACNFPLSAYIKEKAQAEGDPPETAWDRLVDDD